MDISTYTLFSDHELVDLLKSGDHKAYTEIYHRFKGVLYLHAYKRLGNREEARDIIQELFTALWNNRNDLTIKTYLSGYLYTAVRNRVIKVISHKHVESEYISSIQDSFNVSASITDYRIREKQLSLIIEKEIAELPPKMREVFNLSRKDNLSHKEIAELLGLSETTVKKQVNNALKILRSKLGVMLLMILYYNS